MSPSLSISLLSLPEAWKVVAEEMSSKREREKEKHLIVILLCNEQSNPNAESTEKMEGREKADFSYFVIYLF